MPLNVLIDTDPGIDDAVALALAARLQSVDIAAITTVSGNADIGRATRNARLLCERFGIVAPVVAGAPRPLRRDAAPSRETHGDEGLGYFRPIEPPVVEPAGAADLMARLAVERQPLVLCCIGPLTNLALALRQQPGLAQILGPVYAMGGALRERGTPARMAEFNWWADPEAAAEVVAAGLDLRLVPLDVTRRIVIPGEVVDGLRERASDDADASFWADVLGFYVDVRRQFDPLPGCIVHDALAVALVADPELASWDVIRIRVSTTDDERRGLVIEDPLGGYPVRIAIDVDAPAVVGRVTDTIAGRTEPAGEG